MKYSTGEPISNPLRETSGLLSMRGSRAAFDPQTTSSSFPLTIYIIFLANEWPPPYLRVVKLVSLHRHRDTVRLLGEEERQRESCSCFRDYQLSPRDAEYTIEGRSLETWFFVELPRWRKMIGRGENRANPPLCTAMKEHFFPGEFRIPRAFIFTFHDAFPLGSFTSILLTQLVFIRINGRLG